MRQWTIDAFAAQPFKGNPACVVEPFAAWPAEAWMQALAAENNQAETAFLLATDEPARFGLRWFTPNQEVPLCGHATLASGHALLAEIGVAAPTVAFDTLSGSLTVRRDGDLYEMDFPALPPRRVEAPAGLARALGAEPLECWAGQFLIAVLPDEAAVRALAPDMSAVRALSCPAATQGDGIVAVTAPADPASPYDVVSRFFAPGSAIPEDPTTGSLHCGLAPLWGDKLVRDVMRFHQAYPGRGGDLKCERRGGRILLRGQAVTVIESVLRLTPA